MFFPRRKPSGRERERNLTYSSLAGSYELFFGQHKRKFCAMVV